MEQRRLRRCWRTDAVHSIDQTLLRIELPTPRASAISDLTASIAWRCVSSYHDVQCTHWCADCVLVGVLVGVLIGVLSALFSFCDAIAALAQRVNHYPARPIRLIAPFAPGGGVDVSARLIAQCMSETSGHGVIVDNRPSVGGGPQHATEYFVLATGTKLVNLP